MITYDEIRSGKVPISLVGLGYVGLPIAVAFARKIKVIGFDINREKIERYKSGVDATNEVGGEKLKKSRVYFTSDPVDLRAARFHIVAVPTPISADKTPDLGALESACMLLGQNLTASSVVVFESTVYPGVTEDICIPILERESGFICGKDFKVGYSPERINPGDKIHRLETIIKVVSGMDEQSLSLISKVYELAVEAGVYRAPSIKVAEAAKVIENCQRDINIAFMNELALIFGEMGIDTLEVLKAAGTKWNFLSFRPGLVGGHCIGVDPYYLTFCAEQLGYHSQVILAGRRINDSMGKIVAENAIKLMARHNCEKPLRDMKAAILGLTFKEDCPDTRNTKVIDVINTLREYGIEPVVCDPIADKDEAKEHYSLDLVPLERLGKQDVLIVAVGHGCFRQINIAQYLSENGILMDIKGILGAAPGYLYWRL